MNISKIYDGSFADFDKINEYAKNSPEEFVALSEKNYSERVKSLVNIIINLRKDAKVIMLCGPSASGKTTTANLMKQEFDSSGDGAEVISLDDFFKDLSETPLLPNGERDFECIEALQLNKLNACLSDIVNKNECQMPTFNFWERKSVENGRTIKLHNNQVVILEGLHALNPQISKNFSPDKLVKIYISVSKSIKSNDRVLLTSTDLRFLRRLSRDKKFRKADALLTTTMWQNVCDGEMHYISPFRKTASFLLDTFLPYEACLLKNYALDVLNDGSLDGEGFSKIDNIKKYLYCFESLDSTLVPDQSIMREFIGQ